MHWPDEMTIKTAVLYLRHIKADIRSERGLKYAIYESAKIATLEQKGAPPAMGGKPKVLIARSEIDRYVAAMRQRKADRIAKKNAPKKAKGRPGRPRKVNPNGSDRKERS